MHDAHEFLQTLALVLCAAAVTTVVFQRLRQPVVLGLSAGRAWSSGRMCRCRCTADSRTVQTLAELGVILLMFSLGIEFSLSKLLRVGPTARLRRHRAMQPDDVAGLPGRPGVWLVAAAEPLRRCRHCDLQHDDHRQGVRRAADQGAISRTSCSAS